MTKKQKLPLHFLTGHVKGQRSYCKVYCSEKGIFEDTSLAYLLEYSLYGCFAVHHSNDTLDPKNRPRDWKKYTVTFVPSGLVFRYCSKLKDAKRLAELAASAYDRNEHFETFNNGVAGIVEYGFNFYDDIHEHGCTGFRDLLWLQLEYVFRTDIDNIPWINEDLCDPYA